MRPHPSGRCGARPGGAQHAAVCSAQGRRGRPQASSRSVACLALSATHQMSPTRAPDPWGLLHERVAGQVVTYSCSSPRTVLQSWDSTARPVPLTDPTAGWAAPPRLSRGESVRRRFAAALGAGVLGGLTASVPAHSKAPDGIAGNRRASPMAKLSLDSLDNGRSCHRNYVAR